jgi:hypothetical protein
MINKIVPYGVRVLVDFLEMPILLFGQVVDIIPV